MRKKTYPRLTERFLDLEAKVELLVACLEGLMVVTRTLLDESGRKRPTTARRAPKPKKRGG